MICMQSSAASLMLRSGSVQRGTILPNNSPWIAISRDDCKREGREGSRGTGGGRKGGTHAREIMADRKGGLQKKERDGERKGDRGKLCYRCGGKIYYEKERKKESMGRG